MTIDRLPALPEPVWKRFPLTHRILLFVPPDSKPKHRRKKRTLLHLPEGKGRRVREPYALAVTCRTVLGGPVGTSFFR